ncbi:MAG TPA: hypothetical protein VM140_14740 [Burkholderiales bacterium]|nr:hypothetical protein [Burkholderiales bacterium]
MASVVHESPYTRRVSDRHPGAGYAPFLRADGLRVSWGSVIGGVLLAVGLLVLLTALGAAIGISATDPGETEMATLGKGAAIYAAVSLLLALFVGGWAATLMGAISDRATSFCEGALVWIVSILIVGYAATSGIGMLAGGAFKMLGGATQALGSVVQSQTGGGPDVSGNVDQMLQRLRDPGTAQQIAKMTGMQPQEVQSSLNETAQRVEQSRDNPAEAAKAAKDGMAPLIERAKGSIAQKAEEKAEEVKPAATKAAWISFGALLLSLITAVFGAMTGRRRNVVAAA